ncbi:hypothetical protein E1A91_D13G201700v1 [Gossypium mustelinum]|uniref:Uncharacterized protein n=1 Tax=Gossypium mustelinum TaxID=34275 RepID=A0A5D2S438_GOSMU|nr:hypothetical protein E1A91_D13G201700v1 [Gossypium mustelinum]
MTTTDSVGPIQVAVVEAAEVSDAVAEACVGCVAECRPSIEACGG